MGFMSDIKLIKVRLHNAGEDSETPWAEHVGELEDGRVLVRLRNIPFFHAKPTLGDVISATPDESGNLVWDRGGHPFEDIDALIHEDGGRYALVFEYTHSVKDAEQLNEAFGALKTWLLDEHEIAIEGCYAPFGDAPGQLYLAAFDTEDRTPDRLSALLEQNDLGFRFKRVHPAEASEEAGQ